MRFNIVPALVALAVAVPNVSGRVIDGLLGRAVVVDVCAQIDAVLSVDVLGIAVAVGALGMCHIFSLNSSTDVFSRYLSLRWRYRGYPRSQCRR